MYLKVATLQGTVYIKTPKRDFLLDDADISAQFKVSVYNTRLTKFYQNLVHSINQIAIHTGKDVCVLGRHYYYMVVHVKKRRLS
jgi:hypothetical protein